MVYRHTIEATNYVFADGPVTPYCRQVFIY
jgi:hypothetical protein